LKNEISSLNRTWKAIRTISIVIGRRLLLLLKKREVKSLVIVKMDAIGDYILFRNFLGDIRNSDRYNGYSITLIANRLWKDLYEELDKDVVDRVIWIDHKEYASSFSDRREFLSSITDTKYSELIVFYYSRSFITDFLAAAISAKNKVGIAGDRSHLSSRLTDRFYTNLVDIPGDYVHEFSKYAHFTSIVTGRRNLRSAPSIELGSTKRIVDADAIVIAPGAGAPQRQLPIERWKTIITRLVSKGEKVCLIGGPSERDLCSQIMLGVDRHNVIDLAGQTSLADLPHIIANCKLVICNETSTYHFAVALGKMVVCFAGGGHFRRFAAYDESPLIRLVYHPMECFNCNWYCIYPEQAEVTYPCISGIEEHHILKSVEAALESVSNL
jgi:ADP-heptose:LPS heptosyltransferase